MIHHVNSPGPICSSNPFCGLSVCHVIDLDLTKVSEYIFLIKSFCGLLVCHVIDLELDQSLIDRSIIKSTKYYKYQKSILYMKRVLYILRKICLMIEAIMNITNEKTYWRKSIINIV